MKTKIFTAAFLFFICSANVYSQYRPFSEWDATAFCSYTRHHPFDYVKADNNWEIMMALRTPGTREYLDSLGIKNTASQMMLLRIEGLIGWDSDDHTIFSTSMPILDSMQTVEAREFSKSMSEEIYPSIKDDCKCVVELMERQGFGENAFSVLFSHILDGRIWDSLNSFEDLKSSATWDGECWALYFPREFRCGTNEYGNFSLCWTEGQPDFINRELRYRTFIEPFMDDYDKYGKIVSESIFSKALAMGLINKEGTLLIPVLDSRDRESELNVLSGRITTAIAGYFVGSDAVSSFRQRFGIGDGREKLASTMLYHEVMWDLVGHLLDDGVVEIPLVWRDADPKSVYSVVFVDK